MTDIDRLVAGLTCREVLHDLSDFMDGTLTGERVAQLQAHLADCDTCARFGGNVASAVQALRHARPAPDDMPDGAAGRLRTRLRAESARS